jgi:hypothetical protein
MKRKAFLAIGVLTAAVAVGNTATSPSASAATYRWDRVVTVGDSYAAGTGTHYFPNEFDDPSCLKETDQNFTSILAARLTSSQQNQINVSCAGAKFTNIMTQIDRVGSLPNQGARSLIVLYAQGNDIVTREGRSWPDVIKECVLTTDCNRPGNNVANFDTILNQEWTLLDKIIANNPKASIRVMSYIPLFNAQTRADGSHYCYMGGSNRSIKGIWGAFFNAWASIVSTATPGATPKYIPDTWLDPNEGFFIDENIRYFNASVLKYAVDDYLVTPYWKARNIDIKYVDATPEFVGQAYCDASGGHGMEDIIVSTDSRISMNPYGGVSPASFHPGPKGQTLLANGFIARGQ